MSVAASKTLFDPTIVPRCPCGSGLWCRTLHDAAGRFIDLVCDVCVENVAADTYSGQRRDTYSGGSLRSPSPLDIGE